MVAERHVGRGPGIEEDARADSAAGSVRVADGPVLLEGLGAVDGGSIDAGALVELVGGAVMLDRAASLASRALGKVLDMHVEVGGKLALQGCSLHGPRRCSTR